MFGLKVGAIRNSAQLSWRGLAPPALIALTPNAKQTSRPEGLEGLEGPTSSPSSPFLIECAHRTVTFYSRIYTAWASSCLLGLAEGRSHDCCELGCLQHSSLCQTRALDGVFEKWGSRCRSHYGNDYSNCRMFGLDWAPHLLNGSFHMMLVSCRVQGK